MASNVYAVECMRPMVYDWSTTLLSNMKHHLSECKVSRVPNFGFSSILSTFFFERVLGLSPRVDVPLHGVRDPANGVGQMLCADWGVVGWPTHIQLTSFHGGDDRLLP